MPPLQAPTAQLLQQPNLGPSLHLVNLLQVSLHLQMPRLQPIKTTKLIRR